MAQTVYHLGEEVGTGAAFKMVNQLLAGVHIVAACEALAFAKRLGLDLAQVYEVISHAAGSSWMFQNRGPHVVEGDYTPRSAVEISRISASSKTSPTPNGFRRRWREPRCSSF
jgi:L-threonate 2-dehydrogenase